jgi:hypothetical protein
VKGVLDSTTAIVVYPKDQAELDGFGKSLSFLDPQRTKPIIVIRPAGHPDLTVPDYISLNNLNNILAEKNLQVNLKGRIEEIVLKQKSLMQQRAAKSVEEKKPRLWRQLLDSVLGKKSTGPTSSSFISKVTGITGSGKKKKRLKRRQQKPKSVASTPVAEESSKEIFKKVAIVGPNRGQIYEKLGGQPTSEKIPKTFLKEDRLLVQDYDDQGRDKNEHPKAVYGDAAVIVVYPEKDEYIANYVMDMDRYIDDVSKVKIIAIKSEEGPYQLRLPERLQGKVDIEIREKGTEVSLQDLKQAIQRKEERVMRPSPLLHP